MNEFLGTSAFRQLPESRQAALSFDDSNPAKHTQASKPFLRWAGGKTRLLGSLLPLVPKSFNDYHEPFLGSGAMFFALRHQARTCYLADLNSELVNLWRTVQSQPNAFLERLQPYLQRQGEEAYYEVRGEVPTDPMERAARFFYLNQTAWNGLWRENKWGVFNVPWGARAFKGIDADVLANASQALEDVEIRELDFREAAKQTKRGDFIYFDPPYLPISDTSKFAGYNGKRFRKHDLNRPGFQGGPLG